MTIATHQQGAIEMFHPFCAHLDHVLRLSPMDIWVLFCFLLFTAKMQFEFRGTDHNRVLYNILSAVLSDGLSCLPKELKYAEL